MSDYCSECEKIYEYINTNVESVLSWIDRKDWKIEKHKGEKYLMVDDFMLDKVLDKIKKIIGIEKSDDTKIIKSFKKCCNINYVS